MTVCVIVPDTDEAELTAAEQAKRLAIHRRQLAQASERYASAVAAGDHLAAAQEAREVAKWHETLDCTERGFAWRYAPTDGGAEGR